MHKWAPKSLAEPEKRGVRPSGVLGRIRASVDEKSREPDPPPPLGSSLDAALRHARRRADEIRCTAWELARDSDPDEINLFRRHGFGLDLEFARQAADSLGIALGAGVTVGHFDEGWHLDHPYLHPAEKRREFLTIGNGARDRGRAGHGTAVLGMHVGGMATAPGLQPLIPGARMLLIQALDVDGVPATEPLLQAVDQLAGKLPAVLLVARDWSSRVPHLPYELRRGFAEVFAEATARGIVVVQAAGNGGINLDHLARRDGLHVQAQVTMRSDPWLREGDRLSPAFRLETGALMVGATTSTHPLQRWTTGFAYNPQPRSNFGSRVDCCAPGEDIFTATEPDAEGRPQYTSSFGGTSAAAAIVAAAVAALQSLAIASSPAARALPANAVRALFREPDLGTPVLSRGDFIGSMPNLQSICDCALGIDSQSIGS